MKITIKLSVFLFLCCGQAAAPAATINYLYIEASEGNSSGGHCAIQLGDTVYHYQYIEPGLIRLFRQEPSDFHFAYRYLQNRPIHLSRIEVSEETLKALQDYFQWQLLEQEQHYKHLDTISKDRQLLKHLLQRKDSTQPLALSDTRSASLKLKGTGLFYSRRNADQANIDTELSTRQSNSIDALREKIEQHYGRDYLSRVRQTIESTIKTLQPIKWHQSYRLSSGANRPSPIYSFAERYADALSGLFAIKVLQEAQPLQPDAFILLDPQMQGLTTEEHKVLRTLRQQLETALVKSIKSGRPDWGYAALVNLARYLAVDTSLQLNRWAFIDDFDETAEWITPNEFSRNKDHIQPLIDDAKIHLDRSRQTLAHAETISEADYSRLELAANRHHELLKGERQVAVRFNGQQALPGKSAAMPLDLLSVLPEQQLSTALTELDNYHRRFMEQLKDHYHYDLITRNCVTEIFRSIDSALQQHYLQLTGIESTAPVEEIVKTYLGGYVAPAYNFIPFVSYGSVLDQYNVIHTETLPSYRTQEMAKRYADSSDFLVNLRESNILSSTLYRYNPDDALFVFFTDDNILLRPIFGAINTAAGIGQSVFGLLSWPFDGGDNLKYGSTGILMSLPELVFFNMRKGSYKYLPYRQLELP